MNCSEEEGKLALHAPYGFLCPRIHSFCTLPHSAHSHELFTVGSGLGSGIVTVNKTQLVPVLGKLIVLALTLIGPVLELLALGQVAVGWVSPLMTCFLQLRECELSPGVNRDLTRRVRNINGITQHKQIVRNDIKLAAKLIHTLDDRTQLWASEPGTPPLSTVSDSPMRLSKVVDAISSAVGTLVSLEL